MANDQASQLMPRRLWNSNNNNYNNNLWNSDYPAQTPSLWSTVERSDNFSGQLRQKKTKKKNLVSSGFKRKSFYGEKKRKKGGNERKESSFSAKKGKKVGGGKSTWLTRGKWWKIDGAKYTSRVGEKKSGRKPRKIGRKKQKKKRKRYLTMVQICRMSQHLSFSFPTSSRVSERAKRAVRSKWISEWCNQKSQRMSEWPSIYAWILGCTGP